MARRIKTALAARVRNYLVERSLFPETRFRIPALGCLLGCGWSVIYIATDPGSQSERSSHMRDLQSYLGIAFCLFVVFYLEHYLVRRFTTFKLEDRLGLLQSLGSSGLILAGVLAILRPWQVPQVPGSSDVMLIGAAVFGEVIFAWNVIRTFTRDEIVGIIPSPVSRSRPEHGTDHFGWPKSAFTQFAIAGVVFAAGGAVSLILDTPSIRIPIPFLEQIHLVRFGWLVIAAALPFTFYAHLYKGLRDRYRVKFDDSLSRWHFAVTTVGVILVILQWEQSVLYRATSLSGGRALGAMAGLSAMVFAINVYRSFRSKRQSQDG